MHILCKWTKWVDLAESIKPKGVILQERRCKVCNKAERTEVWPVRYL